MRSTKRQCKYMIRYSDGDRQCRQSPVPGQTVCFRHGGNSQAARRKAIERLLMLSEPVLYFLRDVVMDPSRPDVVKLQASKLVLDRVVPTTLSIDATLTHRVPGWEAVIKGMFAAQQPAAIEAGPSLSDLTDAYRERGYTDPETCRNHACRILAREIDSAHELSSADIRALLADLRPEGRYANVIEAEVLPEDRSNPPAPGAQVSRAARVEPTDDRLPSYLASRERAGSARTYGRYN